MRLIGAPALGWALFAILLAGAGFRLLWACDLGAPDMFNLGLKYCPAPVHYAALQDARDRRSELESQIHESELRIAETPHCAAPPPIPGPVSTPESLGIPKRLKDLKGCWVSDRGDIDIKDVITNQSAGRARFCYCFGDNGRGILKYKKTTGTTCKGVITAELGDEALLIDQPAFDCPDSQYIDHIITCKPTGEGRTICSYRSRAYPNSAKSPESFHRADGHQCD